MIVDKVITWLAKRWAEKNLTEANFKIFAAAFWEWITDPNIRETLWRIFKFCVVEIIEEIKKQKRRNDEKTSVA